MKVFVTGGGQSNSQKVVFRTTGKQNHNQNSLDF